jgi:hypothetical protein
MLVCVPIHALAQRGTGYGENQAVAVVPDLSGELLDPASLSRFHLITRASFSDGNKVFSNSSYWSWEARANIRVINGLALAAVLPFGFVDVPGAPNKFFVGNFTAGIAGGGRILLSNEPNPDERAPSLRLGGGLDVYAPTAPKPSMDDTFLFNAQLAIANMRAYEPYLYLSNMMAFRGRAHADFTAGIVTAGIELGLTPAFTLNSNSDFLLWFSGGGRIAVRAGENVEPFLEAGSAIQISGPGLMLGDMGTPTKISPPLLISPGVRFHMLGVDPAAFVSFNFKTTSSVIFAIDLAGAVRSSRTDLSDDIFHGFGPSPEH